MSNDRRNTISHSSTVNRVKNNRRIMKEKIDMLLQYVFIIATIVSTSCLIYVVMWLDALRKGWLV
jgi:hypothetical protein